MAVEQAKSWILPQGLNDYDKDDKGRIGCQCNPHPAFSKCHHVLSLPFPICEMRQPNDVICKGLCRPALSEVCEDTLALARS